MTNNSVPVDKILTISELGFIGAIAQRAKNLYDPLSFKRELLDWFMDIETIHKTIGLRLEDLLYADDGNFGHDLSGIAKHLNRTTKKLEDCFVPRYAS